MLVALAGLLSGYNGHFDFASGATYPEDVPYVAMRVMLATFGVALVPLAWYTAVELGMSARACHLTALMVLLGAYSKDACSVGPNLMFQMSAGFAYLGSSSWMPCFSSSRSLRYSVSQNSTINNISTSSGICHGTP